MGNYAIKKLKAAKYFGLEVSVECAPGPPQSCIIDGLQVSTGCTMGKGNIRMIPASALAVTFINKDTGESVSIGLSDEFSENLKIWLSFGPDLAEIAKQIYDMKPEEMFKLISLFLINPYDSIP